MVATARAAVQTPADLIRYRRELVRTGKTIPLGRMKQIAIGPSANWQPPPADPIIQKYGRLIDLRNRVLPIAQSPDRSLILVTSPLAPDRDGRIGLPDIPDPYWTRPALSRDEIEGRIEVVDGKEQRVLAKRDVAKDTPTMLAQRLTDRCEMVEGQPAILEGTNFLVFQPVLRVTFQPEIQNRLVGTAWILNFCDPEGNLWVDDNGQSCALLIDSRTGEVQFHGGRYDIFSGFGE